MRNARWNRTGSAVWIALAATSLIASEPEPRTIAAPEILAASRAKLEALVEKDQLPSIAVAVARDGRIIWQEAFGWADREGKIRATPDTIYGLGSLGKSVTATAVMVLVERGRIGLDDPIDRHLGSTPLSVYEGESSAVTVRRLLNMTSAVPHGGLNFQDEEDGAGYTLADLVRRRGIVVFPPGEHHVYSNFAFGVLEHLVESVSGRRFDDFVESEVFRPLGMLHSSFGNGHPPEASVAVGYDDGSPLPPGGSSIPQSSLDGHASVRDLMRYGLFHLKQPRSGQRRILRDETLDTMHLDRPIDVPFALMALGWASIDLGDDMLLLLTNGRVTGASSTLSLLPSEGLAVAILTNATTQGITDQLAVEITDALQPGFASVFENVRAAYESESRKSYEPTPRWIGDWVGEIVCPSGRIAGSMIFQQDGDVHVELEDQHATLLNNVRIEEGRLQGEFLGRIPVEEADEGYQAIRVELRNVGDRISGSATAVFDTDRGRFSLPAYVRLRRAERDAGTND